MPQEETKDTPHIPFHNQRTAVTDKDKQRKEFERRAKQLRADFAVTFGTAEGKRVLQWIIETSGYHKTDVGGNPELGMDVFQGTFYNACRKALYLEMRQLIPADTLKQVEYESIQEIFE